MCRVSGRSSGGRCPVLRPHPVIVLTADFFRVADPGVDRLVVDIRIAIQIVRSAATKVHENLRPNLDARFHYKPDGVRAEVPATVGPGDHVDGSRQPLAKCPLKVGPQLAENRYHANATTRMVLNLLFVDAKPRVLPVDIGPFEILDLARKADTAVSGQRENEPPVVVRADGDDPLDNLRRDIEDPSVVGLWPAKHVGERVHGNKPTPDGGLEELPRPPQVDRR